MPRILDTEVLGVLHILGEMQDIKISPLVRLQFQLTVNLNIFLRTNPMTNGNDVPIDARLIKQLRAQTGAGIMECKKILKQSMGDIGKAVDLLRASGSIKAAKRSGKIAAEGGVFISSADDGSNCVLIEMNCETDFVARGDDFLSFGGKAANIALHNNAENMDDLLALRFDNEDNVGKAVQALAAKIGENIGIRRISCVEKKGDLLGVYLHGNRIGVIVDMLGGDAATAKDIAMHIAASRPACLDRSSVPAEILDRERAVLRAQAAKTGKPANIVEQMVTGRLKKFFNEIVLLEQTFVKNADISVSALTQQHKAEILSFVRFETGEGIEKQDQNFVGEVMSQVQESQQS